MRSKAELQSKFKNYMSKPMRARQSYKVGYGGVIGCPAATQVLRLPGSFSVNNEEKFMNFLEAMSKKRSMESNLQEEEIRNAMKDEYGGLKRSYSSTVGLARIDEEKPCYFEEDVLYARSRSYA
ncbi:hypothetical protein CRYUN_Cryun18bG0089900 [Craigia yunnanensis]